MIRLTLGLMRAFVLAGGASLGSVQVGMLRALFERGITPDLIVGTSDGAINGAFIAGRSSLDGIDALGDVWRGLTRSRVFPTRPITGLFGFLGRGPHLVPNEPLRKVLERHMPMRSLEDAGVDVHVVATDLMAGTERTISSGDAVQAVLASASIPGARWPSRQPGRSVWLCSRSMCWCTAGRPTTSPPIATLWICESLHRCTRSVCPDRLLTSRSADTRRVRVDEPVARRHRRAPASHHRDAAQPPARVIRRRSAGTVTR